MEIAEAVRNTSIFGSLEAAELDDVLKIIRERRFLEGDVIMREGDDGDSLYILAEGEVGVSKSLTMKFADDDYRETEKVLTRFRDADRVIFGEMALIGRDNRSATVMAKTDCTLAEIRREEFMALIEGRPQIGVKILMKVAELLVVRLRQASRDVIRLTTALSIALSK
ncbi:MAG: cyclic nucleotide-binding domain-containing protein [Deltaproteobacteria bacterium]|nr:cyclic nucleotide-binding domain-containing protein [Deltaproteobacteria bacterium]